MAYAVAERTREIGIRVALGATRPAVLREVLLEAMRAHARRTRARLVVAAQALTRLIPRCCSASALPDAQTYVTVSLVLGGVALLASYVPARRAMRIDPLVALKQE